MTSFQSNTSGLYLCIKAQNARPSLQAEDILVIFTPGYPAKDVRHQSCNAAGPNRPIFQNRLVVVTNQENRAGYLSVSHRVQPQTDISKQSAGQ